MNAQNDRWLDELLQQPHVDDGGFADGVVARVDVAPVEGGRGIVVAFTAVSVVVGLFFVAAYLQEHHLSALSFSSLGAKLLAACAAVFAAVAAALSGESLKLNNLRQLAAAGPTTLSLPEHLDEAGSAAAVPSLNVALKKHAAPIARTEDLDDDTAREVIRAARKHRSLFGTVWFFFLAAPFLLIASENVGIIDGSWMILDVIVAMVFGGFLLGTPIVWLTSRQAFFRECEQLGITRQLARRLRWRLTVANLSYSPGAEAEERAVRRLRQLAAPPK